jgi:signal transduction histidine kinase
MSPRRWWLLLLLAASLAWAIGGEWVSITHGDTENHLLDALVGLSFFGAGIVAMDRRPGNIIGPLMIGYAATWFLGNWGNLGVPPLTTLGLIGATLSTPFLAHILFVYPSGRLRTTFERVVLWIVYVSSIGASVVIALTWNPRVFGCSTCWDTHAPFPSARVNDVAQQVSDRAPIILVPLFISVLVLRWREASRAERRELAPLWTASSILAIVYLIGSFASADPRDPFAYLLWELNSILQLFVPVIFAWGLLSTRLAQSAVGHLVVELERPLLPGGLRDALARTLGDPTLEVAYAIEGQDRWVDANGQRVALSERPTDRRAVTVIEPEGTPLAALIHDPALDEGLVRAAGAAAGMAIANERLRAQVQAQLEEVRASRQRIVEAGDRERRRVERNLHDGAQQRLVTLSLGLALLQQREDLVPEAREVLAQASAELRSAMSELRELARGIHPAILTEEGLAAAVESVADRSSVPVQLHIALGGRLPEPVESTAYYVVSESLANVAKYAEASVARVDLARRNGSLRVEVVDDGKGGADVDRGSGLGGLEDRVAAVGGTLRIESPHGEGTRVLAEIPSDG